MPRGTCAVTNMSRATVLTQLFLHKLGRQSIGFGGSSHTQRLMWALVVIKLDPVTDDPHGVLLRFKAISMNSLLLEGKDQSLHHPVLLWAMWGDELLL